jgi:nucleoside 2-deoxyribosyltransferase
LKIYVAGKWQERILCRTIMSELEKAGHKITCDWTNHDYPDPTLPESEQRAFLQRWALLDIAGVQDADVLVFVAFNKNDYRGAFVELGAAIGLGKRVFVIGNAIDSCIFVAHPLVKKVVDFDELLERLYELEHNRAIL